jgi:hypothetical protein
MRRPRTVDALTSLGRVRLSDNFFMRDFLHSEIAEIYGIANIPDDPDLAITAGTRLCQDLLEPLGKRFGRISIRSGYRSPAVNQTGNENGLNCASNEANFAGHIWDRRDGAGRMGATACVVVNAFIPYYEQSGDWQAMAWWVHDHLPYNVLEFFPRYAAFNLGWREKPERKILSFIPPKRGYLTRPGMDNHSGSHADAYQPLANIGSSPAER